MKRKRTLCESEVARIFVQIAHGVEHMHRMGIVHRDLKLANILQTHDRQIKIGDFGMATYVNSEQTK